MRGSNNNKNNGFYVYGKNPVTELLSDNPQDVSEVAFVDFNDRDKSEFASIITIAKQSKIKIRYISKRDAEQLTGGGVRTQRVLAKYRGFKYLTYKEWQTKLSNDANKLVLVLDKLEDPQNFGAIVRSAGAAGVSAVFVANASQAPVTATVFKTSAGVITKVPIVQVANISDTLEKLKTDGFWSYGVTMQETSDTSEYDSGSVSMWSVEFDNKSALVVGAEGSGLSRVAKEHCDFLVHIPMYSGVESLNVSVAAALTMYEWRRQQS
jgi:23S rRNA (guanosine2251-2'-O)-methyltransferase